MRKVQYFINFNFVSYIRKKILPLRRNLHTLSPPTLRAEAPSKSLTQHIYTKKVIVNAATAKKRTDDDEVGETPLTLIRERTAKLKALDDK